WLGVGEPAHAETRQAPEAREEAAASERDHTQAHLVAVQLAHPRPDIRDTVDEAEFERLPPRPEGPREKLVLRSCQSRAPALLDEGYEGFMDVLLQRAQTRDVLGLLGLERIENRLVRTRGVDAAIDAELLDGLVEAEACRDDADRAHDRRGIGIDLVAGDGE